MESNESRGKRALWWMKFTFVLSIFIGAMALFLIFGISWDGLGEKSQNPAGVMLYTLTFFLAFFIFILVWSIAQIFWLLWMFRSVKNLRKLTNTAFSPWGAVICSCLPYVGFLIHYFVFKNLVQQIEVTLNGYWKSPSKTASEILENLQPVNMNLVNGFVIMAVLSGAVNFIRDTNFSAVLTLVFSVVSFVCYIKSLDALIKEERSLFEIYNDQLLRQKVEQVLREREEKPENIYDKV